MGLQNLGLSGISLTESKPFVPVGTHSHIVPSNQDYAPVARTAESCSSAMPKEVISVYCQQMKGEINEPLCGSIVKSVDVPLILGAHGSVLLPQGT